MFPYLEMMLLITMCTILIFFWLYLGRLACSMKVSLISFLGENPHGTGNTATHLALLTTIVGPLLSFTDIFK
jgi:hypothetical protein